jgi:hypothetical protein
MHKTDRFFLNFPVCLSRACLRHVDNGSKKVSVSRTGLLRERSQAPGERFWGCRPVGDAAVLPLVVPVGVNLEVLHRDALAIHLTTTTSREEEENTPHKKPEKEREKSGT